MVQNGENNGVQSVIRSENKKEMAKRMIELISRNDLSDIQKDIERNMRMAKELMAYYQCAILEVETKFKVLNEQFSVEHERNPIESIRSRLKSPESIHEKMNRKGIPFSVSAIEEKDHRHGVLGQSGA